MLADSVGRAVVISTDLAYPVAIQNCWIYARTCFQDRWRHTAFPIQNDASDIGSKCEMIL